MNAEIKLKSRKSSKVTNLLDSWGSCWSIGFTCFLMIGIVFVSRNNSFWFWGSRSHCIVSMSHQISFLTVANHVFKLSQYHYHHHSITDIIRIVTLWQSSSSVSQIRFPAELNWNSLPSWCTWFHSILPWSLRMVFCRSLRRGRPSPGLSCLRKMAACETI